MVDDKERAARLSVAVSTALAAAKLGAALVTGSLALLADALHSLIDIGAALMTLYAVRLAAKPADADHHYGHGKIESVTALIEVGLLVAVALFAAAEALARLHGGVAAIDHAWAAIAVLVVAVPVDYLRARALNRLAARTQSHALASNALHFTSDMWQSLLVLLGLAASVAGIGWADPVAALAIAAFIVVAAAQLGRRTINALMDMAPPGATEAIRAAASGVSGVQGVERVRARAIGPLTLADVAVAVPRSFTPERIALVERAVAEAIAAAVPGAETVVTSVPRALHTETVLERVLVTAAGRRLPVHHVTVQDLNGRLAVALDLEVDGRLTLSAAHGIASKLEAAIRQDLGADTEVETHLEPLDPRHLPGTPAPDAMHAALCGLLAALVPDGGLLSHPHDIRVRETGKGLVVVLHCHAPASATVAAVHDAVDALERRLRAERPDVARAVIHAEPPTADAAPPAR